MKRLNSSEGLSTAVEKVRNKRDWVKNAVIIFLVVMLLLTFFSNSIMNYSLPEVAAQYPQSTTITTKIRGSGTVEAAQTYNVTLQESRTVAAVNVKVGDTVQAGDTLLTLDEAESQELTDARNSLATLKLEYDKMQLTKGDQSHTSQFNLQQLQEAVSNAESDLYAAQQYENDIAWYDEQISAANSTLASRNLSVDAAQNKVNNLAASATEESVKNANSSYLSAMNQVQSLIESGASDPASDRYGEYEAAVQERDRIYQEQIAPTLADLTYQLGVAQQELSDAQYAQSQAQAAVNSANEAKSNYTASYSGPTSVSAAETALQTARDALSQAEAAAADEAAQKEYDDAVAAMDLEAKAQEVAAAEERVHALEEKTAAAMVVSRYAGVVQSVNIAAGDTTSAEVPLVVVELTEKGYTLNATVTKEQARSLREGMTAEITNIWNSGITLTLGSITADKNNPAASRVLAFSVQGEEVIVGQQLNFSIGDKNASYDVVVPSAAVHSDADGSFVYTVTVKASPLGNRYSVKKTTVEVIASDDTHSALAGDISTADFVITTSTVPLQPGDQVRIAE